mmetsp:Transcript_35682/g.96826  ORF Transcript_35682/g.96826 Transcript_35682/m.96826 type:complete len:325 (-) Transcript_35682:45-1019(-)
MEPVVEVNVAEAPRPAVLLELRVLKQFGPLEDVAAKAIDHRLLHCSDDKPLAIARPVPGLHAAVVPRGMPIVALKARLQRLLNVHALEVQGGAKLAGDNFLALPCSAPGHQRTEDGREERHGADLVRERRVHEDWAVRRPAPLRGGHAREGLCHRIERRVLAELPLGAKAGVACIDYPGVPLLELLVPKAKLVHDPGPEILADDVCPVPDEALNHCQSSRVFQVQRYGALSAVLHLERCEVPWVALHDSEALPLRRLHLDHVRSALHRQGGRHRTVDICREIQDADTGQWTADAWRSAHRHKSAQEWTSAVKRTAAPGRLRCHG